MKKIHCQNQIESLITHIFTFFVEEVEISEVISKSSFNR